MLFVLLQDLAMSSYDPTQELGELITYSWTDGSALQTRTTTYSMITGKLLTDFSSPVNSKLQNVATVRMDRDYIGVGAWGDTGTDNVPTVYLLKAGSNVPLFNYTSPGR
jgi:hypothetical protein